MDIFHVPLVVETRFEVEVADFACGVNFHVILRFCDGIELHFALCALLVSFYVSGNCLLYTSPSPRDKRQSRMPSSA